MRRFLLAAAVDGAFTAATPAPSGIKTERAESIGARLELLSSEVGAFVRAVWRS